MSASFKVVGTRVPRIDGASLVTGSAKFSNDVILPNMLYGRILKSPYPHANITAIDTSKALALPGVKAVITYKDVPNLTITGSQSAPFGTSDRYILENIVRHVGDPVAAVAATDPFTAEAALDLINVTYQQLPFVVTATDAVAPGAPLVHSNVAGNVYSTGSGNYGTGSASTAMAASAYTYKLTRSTQKEIMTPMQPFCTVFDWPPGGKLTVYDAQQGSVLTAAVLGYYLGIGESQIEVKDQWMGCGLGINAYRYHPIGAILARKAGLPVKMEPGQVYHFISDTKTRAAGVATTQVGINSNGTLQALICNATYDKGAYGSASTSNESLSILYNLPASLTYQTVETDTPGTGACRGVGNPQGNFFVETVVNQAAETLGLDPLTIRLNSAITTGYNGLVAVGLTDCLNKGATAFGWAGAWQPYKSKTNTGPVMTGLACVCGPHDTGSTGANQSAAVMMNADGTATVMVSAVEMGQGLPTTMAMIAAEELGMQYQHVGIEWGNSSLPEDQSEAATRTTHNVGKAVQNACDNLMAQLMTVAATALGTTASNLSYGNETIYVTASPTQSVTYQAVMLKASRSLIGYGVYGTPHPSSVVEQIWYALFGEVTVDTGTGDVNVKRMVMAHDVGQVLNLNGCENQAYGGAYEALGWGLSSLYSVDSVTGIPLTTDYLNYGVYPLDQTFPMTPLMVSSNDAYGPFGAKGIGEAPHNGPLALVASAIYNAIGVWVDPPFTAAAVLKALGKV
jgi:xanthine dehydrogenase molybdenum-binding subunit